MTLLCKGITINHIFHLKTEIDHFKKMLCSRSWYRRGLGDCIYLTQPPVFPGYAPWVHSHFLRVTHPHKCASSQVCLVPPAVCSSRKGCRVLWEVSGSIMLCSILQHGSTDSLKRLYRLKSNIFVCVTLGILVHISLNEEVVYDIQY